VLATVVATESPAPKARTNRPDPVGPNFDRKNPATRPPTQMPSGLPSQRSTAQPRGFHICGARIRRPIASTKVVSTSHAGLSAGRDDHRMAGAATPTAMSTTGTTRQITAAGHEPRTPLRSSPTPLSSPTRPGTRAAGRGSVAGRNRQPELPENVAPIDRAPSTSAHERATRSGGWWPGSQLP